MSLNTRVTRGDIWNIAYPIMFGNLAQTLIALTDTMFLGRVSGVVLGASMMAGIYYFIWGTLAWGFAIGLQILIARRLGEGRLDRIGVVFQHGLGVVAILAVTLLVLLHFATEPVLTAVIQSPNVLVEALKYMDYRYFGIFFVCFNYLFRYFYIGLSSTKIIVYSTVIMAVVNIILNYLLIFGKFGFPEMGIGGAALASVIAEVSALVFFVGYTLVKLPLKDYSMTTRHKLEPWLVKAIFKLATPTMVQKLLAFGTWFIFFIFVEHMGELPIAVSGLIRSMYMLLGVPIFAFGATASTIVSRLIGEGRKDEVMPTLIRISGISILSVIPMLLICIFFPTEVLSIYMDDPVILAASVDALYVLCGAIASMTVAFIYFEAISGTGNTMHGLIVEMGVLVFYTIAIWVLTKVLMVDVSIAWSCEIVYGILMSLFSVLYMKYYPWQKKIL